MEFREFFEEQERIDESLLDIAKGGLGIAKGIGNTFAGAMTMGDEALAKMVGQGTKGRFARGSGRFGRGVRQIFLGDPPSAKPQQAPAQQETQPQKAAPAQQETQPRKEEEVSFRCPNGHKLHAPARLVGRNAKCPKCSVQVRIPDPMERPQPRQAQGRPLLQGEPKPNERYAELSKNWETAKNNNNQQVMSHIQYMMGKADPVYYQYAREQGHFSGRGKT